MTQENLVLNMESSTEDIQYIYAKIVEFNFKKAPPTQENSFEIISINYKDGNNNIRAGMIASLYMWRIINIDVLWVDETLRKSGLGTKMLRKLEKIAKKKNCKLIHVDTFSFQAPEFYKKNGFEVFGVLENCPPGHQRYFLKKDL